MFINSYKIKDNNLYHDNMSTMRMEKNRRKSAGQKARHINIRYFFIKDRIQNGELNILHCATDKMIEDLFTEPLQSALFKLCRHHHGHQTLLMFGGSKPIKPGVC